VLGRQADTDVAGRDLLAYLPAQIADGAVLANLMLAGAWPGGKPSSARYTSGHACRRFSISSC
jgi:hypothetical protein